MESFLWSLATALTVGVATISWTTPRLYQLLPQWVLSTGFFAVIGAFQIWDYAVRFDNAKVRAAYPDKALDILALADTSQVPFSWWLATFCIFAYLSLLHLVALLKIHHDEKLKSPNKP